MIILRRVMMVMSIILNNSTYKYIFAGAFLVILILVVILIKQKNTKRSILERENLLEELIRKLDISDGLENSLLSILSLLEHYVSGRDYVFYIFERRNSNYVIKSIRSLEVSGGPIEPSYSGLLPYRKEKYIPPISLTAESFPEQTKIVNDGNVPVLAMPVKGGLGVIRISPVSRVPLKTLKMLDYLSSRLQTIISTLVETELLRNQVKSALSAEKAVHNISNIFTDMMNTLDLLMGLTMKTIGASGGLFIKEEAGAFTVQAIRGLEKTGEESMRNDSSILHSFSKLVGDDQYYIIRKEEPDYVDIPPYLVAAGAEVILLIGVPFEKGRCIAAFWGLSSTRLFSAKDYQITAALLMAKRMGDILNNHLKFKEYSKSYVKMLKFLANMLDNLSPYTVGYSELMSHYSMIIAREMNLDPEEMKDISLAAYLSNIGVLGLTDNLFHKQGKFTDFEYEMMKLHTDVGASIIEATITNQRVADIIRYHHERIDGNGYMTGLKGEEIPIGARIIAVVQTFLAKIMGREYRAPLPFGEALDLLKSVSGTQLDKKVVDILVNWFERKERDNIKNKCSLGYCWEMRCCPESISAGCPVYKNTSINCWDSPGNNCRAHGNSCSTCYIHTEYLHRMDQRI